jgi:hypothetical protein
VDLQQPWITLKLEQQQAELLQIVCIKPALLSSVNEEDKFNR